MASKYAQLDVVKLLIKANANPFLTTRVGTTALIEAYKNKKYKIVAELANHMSEFDEEHNTEHDNEPDEMNPNMQYVPMINDADIIDVLDEIQQD